MSRQASLTLEQILFPQCPAIWRAKSCHLTWDKVCQDGKVTHSLRHVVPSIKRKFRTVHKMRDSQCYAYALKNFVVTSRNAVGINF